VHSGQSKAGVVLRVSKVFIQRERRENGVKINISTIVGQNQETEEQ
jgi:hypothetical protein